MKRFLSILLSIAVMVTMCMAPISAENLPTVTVSSIEDAAAIGQDVELKVSVANNPGFTNFDWLVKYDTDRLNLKAFKTSYMSYNEEEETDVEVSYLSPLIAESYVSTGKISAAGSSVCKKAKGILFKLVFTVKENAPSGKAEVSIVSSNIKNSGVALTFDYVSGYVNVDGIDCDEGHDWGDWQTITEPTCEEEGLKVRTCKRAYCGIEDTEAIPELGHSYGKWTEVDEYTHKKVCANDEDHVLTGDHNFVDGICADCGYEDVAGDTTGGNGETSGENGETSGGNGETSGENGETSGGNGETSGGNGESSGGNGETEGGEETEVPSVGETTGWEDIKEVIKDVVSQPEGSKVVVEMNGAQEVPADIFEQIVENKVTVEFNMGSGVTWTIDGADIPEEVNFSKINLNVQLNVTTIPDDVVDDIQAKETVQVELAHDGEFGFAMQLNVELGAINAGFWANLYYFNIDTNSLEFQEAIEIDANGNAKFGFNHASSYVIAIDNESHDVGDSSGGNGETSGGNGETSGGNGETSGGNGETSGGNGETSGGNGETSGGNGETSGGNGETSGGNGETSGGNGETSGGNGETSGGNGETSGGNGETSGGNGETSGGNGETSGGNGETSGGNGETSGGNGETSGGSGETPGGPGETPDDPCATGHSYGDWTKVDDNNHKKECACGDVVTEAHTWDAGVETTPATHTTFGEMTYTCTANCGATKTERIDKTTGHSYGGWVNVDANNHSKECACGDVVTEAHTWDAGVETTPATHTTFGEMTYTCTANCGATKTERIDKTTGHSYGDWTKVDDNNHKKECACGDVVTEPHTWDGGVITTPATYMSTGVKTYTCTACGATKEEEIPRLINYSNNYGGGSAEPSKYTVRFDSNGGSAVASKTVKKDGVLAMPTAPTKEGYKFVGWYTDAALTIPYDFATEVTKGFTLYAKWEEVKEDDKDTDKPATTMTFNDVKETDWYYEAVKFVNENGLMNGVAEEEFAPEMLLTRAMIVTVLYRVEGEPAVNRSIPFADIDMGAYYANAVIWAHQNGIVNGISETHFAPDVNITREQMVAIIFRYAQYKGVDILTLEENLGFADAHEISEYAISALNWAVGNGIIKGRAGNKVHPTDTATRAEVATIFYRFLGPKN